MGHLKHAFSAFCKKNRREVLTEEEAGALLYCREHSLLPTEPAVMRQVKPHPDFNWYNFCLPDVLHTELGGHQKDWIFWVCVVVNEVGKISRKYTKNLQKLDELVAQFPVQQSVGIKLKRFHEGVSVYVTKADDTKEKKGVSFFYLYTCTMLVTYIRFILLYIYVLCTYPHALCCLENNQA